MKRSKIATFKFKDHPKNEKTKSYFGIGDYFRIDFDKCLSEIKINGFIHLKEFNETYKIFPDEIYLIRMTYVDKYDVDFDSEKNELEKCLIKN